MADFNKKPPPYRGRPKVRSDDRARRDVPKKEQGPPLIWGIHAVEAALANDKRGINRLFLTENAEHRLKAALEPRGLPVERVSPRDLDRRLGADTVHQGALAEVEPLEEPSIARLARKAAGRPLIVLDQVTDPHNVGAILRSAAVFGSAGLVMTRRHSPPLDGALAKAASGALELVPIALVQNLASALSEMKDAGFTLVGLEGTAETELETMPWPERIAIVLGAEGKGLRQLTKETCDHLARVATDGPIASLNVSNAAAIALHTAVLSRRNLISPPGRG
jgi:23S rRNA (guanosine2251-2'-O)-methyltransferase